MNRIWIILFCFIIFACASTKEANVTDTATSSYYSFDNALETGTRKIQNDLPEGSKVAILAFKSDNENLSSYIVEEMYDKLINFGMTVLERIFTNAIAMEVGYQLSGEVDDREIVRIGNQLGANYVVTGQITFYGEAYRLRVFAIDIEKAQRIASSSLNISANDRQIGYLLTSQNLQAQTAVVQEKEPENYQGYALSRTRQGKEQVLTGFYNRRLGFAFFIYVDKPVYDILINEIKREFGNINSDSEVIINNKSRKSCIDAFNSIVDFAWADMAVIKEDNSYAYYSYNKNWLMIKSESNEYFSIILLMDKI